MRTPRQLALRGCSMPALHQPTSPALPVSAGVPWARVIPRTEPRPAHHGRPPPAPLGRARDHSVLRCRRHRDRRPLPPSTTPRPAPVRLSPTDPLRGHRTAATPAPRASLTSYTGKCPIWRVAFGSGLTTPRALDDPAYTEALAWSPDGKSFVVGEKGLFSPQLLADLGTASYEPFIRRLYYFGFRKINGTFQHSQFVRDPPCPTAERVIPST